MRAWRRRTLLGLGLILLLVLQLALPAFAADPGRPQFVSLSITPSVQAGQPLHIAVQATMPNATEGLCCGSILLQSPSGKQKIILHLTLNGGQLTADTTLSPGAEGGTWKVQRLNLVGNGLADTLLEASADFNYTFQVYAGTPDTTPPTLTSLAWSVPNAAQGAPVTIVANATDNATGVASMTAVVVPVQDAGDPRWQVYVRMEKQADNSWAGTFLAPVMSIPKGKVRISEVYFRDGAGNLTDLSGSTLSALQPADLKVALATTPPGLQTDPYLTNLLFPGSLNYMQWNEKDLDNLSQLWDQMGTDPEGMKATVNYQLMLLQHSLSDLRKEIYQDPTSKYRFVPYNTSGKWRAVDKAISSRLLLLTEAQRRAGLSTAQRLEKQDFMGIADILFADGRVLTAYSPSSYSQAAPALMNAVINTINRSSLPSGLMLAPHRAPDDDGLSYVDSGLIWFQPFNNGGVLAEHFDSGQEISLFLNDTVTPLEMVKDLFHEMGHHFHDAFMINPDGYSFDSTAWNDYLRLRGNQSWNDKAGWGGRPWENFAEDFAYATLPADLRPQYLTNTTSYPRLMDQPAMLQAFRDFLSSRVAAGPELPLTFDSPDRLLLANQTAQITGHWLPNAQYLVATTTAVDSSFVKSAWASANPDGSFAINAPLQAYGPNYVWIGLKPAGSQNPHLRLLTVLNSAFLPSTLLPRATNQPTVTVDGSVTGSMLINGQATSTAVHNSVALIPGENNITFDITPTTGKPYKLTTQVFYEPAGTTVPLTVSAPATVNSTYVTVTGTTAPYALVSVGSAHTGAGSDGAFRLPVSNLTGGENSLTVTATSPAGNTATSKVTVTNRASQGITVQVPAITNAARLKVTGSAVGSSQVTVAGQAAALDAKGNYSAVVNLVRGNNTLDIVAVDASGSPTRISRTVTLDPNLVPAYANADTVDWTGVAPSGAQVKFQGQAVQLGSDGTYRVTLPLSKGGTNTFRLDITPASGAPVYYEASVVKPVGLDAPAYTNVEALTLQGSTGGTFYVNYQDRALRITPDGTFRLPVQLLSGANTFSFATSRISAPWADASVSGAVPTTATSSFTVSRFDPKGSFSGDVWTGTLPPVADGTVFTVRGTKISVTEHTGTPTTIQIPLQKGYNDIRIDYQDANGAPAYVELGLSVGEPVVLMIGSTSARVGDHDHTLTVPPQKVGGVTMVPLRFVAEALNANVDYDVTTHTITFTRNTHTVVLTVGSDQANVDGKTLTMAQPAQVVEGRTLVPLRFVVESLGVHLNWDNDTQTITLTP